mmetsp:Transcript_36328/g.97285  ORF Transcript_36328/g.97285 Transcript_36328/m.97285 type:complete len:307 (+) Transcript_36328:1807-2727(+)
MLQTVRRLHLNSCEALGRTRGPGTSRRPIGTKKSAGLWQPCPSSARHQQRRYTPASAQFGAPHSKMAVTEFGMDMPPPAKPQTPLSTGAPGSQSTVLVLLVLLAFPPSVPSVLMASTHGSSGPTESMSCSAVVIWGPCCNHPPLSQACGGSCSCPNDHSVGLSAAWPQTSSTATRSPPCRPLPATLRTTHSTPMLQAAAASCRRGPKTTRRPAGARKPAPPTGRTAGHGSSLPAAGPHQQRRYSPPSITSGSPPHENELPCSRDGSDTPSFRKPGTPTLCAGVSPTQAQPIAVSGTTARRPPFLSP